MGNEVVRAIDRPVTAFTDEQVNLLKRTIAKGTSDDEFALFVGVCKRTGLDPFARQIFAVKRWDSRERKEVMSIQTSIDGYRLIADRACRARSAMRNEEETVWCGPDGEWKDVWLSSEPPVAARYVALITGPNGTARYSAVARWDEYVQTTKNGDPTAMWVRMPTLMLAKCAEALALRKAFPAELGDVYTEDEMMQADEPRTPAMPSERQPDRPMSEENVARFLDAAHTAGADDAAIAEMVSTATNGRTSDPLELWVGDVKPLRDALTEFEQRPMGDEPETEEVEEAEVVADEEPAEA